MIYLLINNIVSAVLIFFAYKLGLMNGQKVATGEKISLPNIAEIKEEREQKREEKEESDKYKKILNNIDVYDGTDEGQIDV